jgi:hypothetical protein
MLQKHRYEAYVMFQLTTCCKRPVPLYHFLAATLSLTAGQRKCPGLESLSENQMELAWTIDLLDSWEFLPLVLFSSSTRPAKEFMVTGEGRIVISESINLATSLKIADTC